MGGSRGRLGKGSVRGATTLTVYPLQNESSLCGRWGRGEVRAGGDGRTRPLATSMARGRCWGARGPRTCRGAHCASPPRRPRPAPAPGTGRARRRPTPRGPSRVRSASVSRGVHCGVVPEGHRSLTPAVAAAVAPWPTQSCPDDRSVTERGGRPLSRPPGTRRPPGYRRTPAFQPQVHRRGASVGPRPPFQTTAQSTVGRD